jgi:hypothetical protein
LDAFDRLDFLDFLRYWLACPSNKADMKKKQAEMGKVSPNPLGCLKNTLTFVS